MKFSMWPALVLLTGCSWAPGTDANLISKAETAVRYQAKDGASLQFRNERVDREAMLAAGVGGNFQDVAPIVCGEVNGKNEFGALTGFRPFGYYAPSQSVVIRPESPADINTSNAVLNFPDKCAPPKPNPSTSGPAR